MCVCEEEGLWKVHFNECEWSNLELLQCFMWDATIFPSATLINHRDSFPLFFFLLSFKPTTPYLIMKRGEEGGKEEKKGEKEFLQCFLNMFKCEPGCLGAFVVGLMEPTQAL